MQLENEINNNIDIKNEQKNFLDSALGKTINVGIDIGLRAILPDLIENQIIDIKNALFENGLKEGIKTAIDSAIDFGKSALGIFTGNFENMDQINIAIGNGGIIDSLSNLIDKISNKACTKGFIDSNINSIVKKGKNIILDNISNNIMKELEKQTYSVDKLEGYIKSWKENYENKNFDGMQKEYKKIKNQLNKVVPFENLIKEARDVENIHKLISNNGYNFDISDLEKEIIKKL